jgi:uncharacterized protein YjbJ (UPF0337 family)
MNRDMLRGQWKQIQGRIKNAWGELTDDDLARVEGDWDKLVGKIQERTGQVREDVERGLNNLLDRIAEETRVGYDPMNEPRTDY